MGVADYIMIDGFKQLVGSNAANMELLCRGMTFYGSVITSAVIILSLIHISPVHIPNTMVKTEAADNTILVTVWEGRWLPDL